MRSTAPIPPAATPWFASSSSSPDCNQGGLRAALIEFAWKPLRPGQGGLGRRSGAAAESPHLDSSVTFSRRRPRVRAPAERLPAGVNEKNQRRSSSTFSEASLPRFGKTGPRNAFREVRLGSMTRPRAAISIRRACSGAPSLAAGLLTKKRSPGEGSPVRERASSSGCRRSWPPAPRPSGAALQTCGRCGPRTAPDRPSNTPGLRGARSVPA